MQKRTRSALRPSAQQRRQSRPHILQDDRLRLRGGMEIVVEKTVPLAVDAFQQERHERGFVPFRQRCVRLFEFARVLRAVVGGHLHSHQQYAGTGLLRRADDDGEVVAHLRHRQSPQAVVGPEDENDDPGPMPRERGRDARGAAAGGLAADARVHHGIIEVFLPQPLLEQCDPALFLGDAGRRRETVPVDEHSRAGMGESGTHQYQHKGEHSQHGGK